jgi:hypothetical protein
MMEMQETRCKRWMFDFTCSSGPGVGWVVCMFVYLADG